MATTVDPDPGMNLRGSARYAAVIWRARRRYHTAQPAPPLAPLGLDDLASSARLNQTLARLFGVPL
jgi:hypothetical protein